MKRIQHSWIARFSLALGLAAALAASASVARANAWDKRTTVNFDQSVEVPGAVLGPGKYVMKVVDLTSQHRAVQFTNERENHVFATALAIPAYRTRVTNDTVLTFYEAPVGQPQALRTWYYPGDSDGQEFVYPHGRISQISAVPRGTTPNTLGTRNEAAPAPAAPPDPVKELTPEPTAAAPPVQSESNAPVEIAQAAPLQQEEPAIVAQNNPPPAPPAPAELPKTASDLPVAALFGFMTLGGAVAARKLRHSSR